MRNAAGKCEVKTGSFKSVEQEDTANKCASLWYRTKNKLCQVEDMLTNRLRVGTSTQELHNVTLICVLADICIAQKKILTVAAFVIKVKEKVTLVRALRLCTGRTAYRGSRGIALTFHDHGTRRG